MNNEELIKQKKLLKNNIIDSIEKKDMNLFFSYVNEISDNEKFKFFPLMQSWQELEEKMISYFIDNIKNLSSNYRTNLRDICINNDDFTKLEKYGENFCKQTNNIEDKIELLLQKAYLLSVNFNIPNYTEKQKEKLVNELFDRLEKHKKEDEFMNVQTYFNIRFELNVFLSTDRLNKLFVENEYNPTPENIMEYLEFNGEKDYLNYYKNKINQKINITVNNKKTRIL